MNVQVRDTQIEEIPFVFRLRHDPAVLCQQYRPSFLDTPKSFAKKLAAGRDLQGVTFSCASIFVDDELIGHILQHKVDGLTGSACHCGWNLEPSYWGRGIMPTALGILFDRIFNTQPRYWRTRKDPFAGVWSEILLWLQDEPDASAKLLFDRLREKHPEHDFPPGQLRTLQRRIRQWRKVLARELVFGSLAEPQATEPSAVINATSGPSA